MKKILLSVAIVLGAGVLAIPYIWNDSNRQDATTPIEEKVRDGGSTDDTGATDPVSSDDTDATPSDTRQGGSLVSLGRRTGLVSKLPDSNAVANPEETVEPLHPAGRYRNVVFDSSDSDKDITYKSTFHTVLIPEDGGYLLEDDESSPVDLKLNVYQPSGDTQSKRPLLIFVYGGGWIQGDRYQQESAAIDFAKRGYVTMTIDYTMFPPDNEMNPVPDPYSTVYPRIIYRSANNIYEAYQWALEHEVVYRIDSQRIGIAGWSAGGLISQALGHVDISQEPIGVRAILGLSNIFSPSFANIPPLGEFRTFTSTFHPVSMFASYDDDVGFAGNPNDHAADCTYLDSIGHDCETVTFPGSGHDAWFDQPPVQSYAVDFLAAKVAGH